MFKIGDKTFKTADFEILRLIREAAKKKDKGAVMVMLAAGEAFGTIKEITKNGKGGLNRDNTKKE